MIDPKVRNVMQIDAKEIQMGPDVFQPIMKDLMDQMSINVEEAGVRCKLYKLLIYETDGHFVKHQDTEKEEGMFGTMIVQIPVEGGYWRSDC